MRFGEGLKSVAAALGVAFCCAAPRADARELYMLTIEPESEYEFSAPCPVGVACISGWRAFFVYGHSLERKHNVSETVAMLGGPHYATDTPFLATLIDVEGDPEYAALGVRYVMTDVQRFQHVVCTSHPALTSYPVDFLAVPEPYPEKRCFSRDRLNSHSPRIHSN